MSDVLNERLMRYGQTITYDKQNELFEEVEVGDIILALMPYNDNELKRIGTGHNIRPYLVIIKNESSVVAFMCTSKRRISEKKENYYILSDMHDELDRTSYINFKDIEEIPKENMIKLVSSITSGDMTNIDHRIYIHNHNKYNLLPSFNVQFGYQKGDIVETKNDGRIYYIFDTINKGVFRAFQLTVTDKENEVISVDGKKYDMIYELETINLENIESPLTACNKDLIVIIDNKYKKNKYNKKRPAITARNRKKNALRRKNYCVIARRHLNVNECNEMHKKVESMKIVNKEMYVDDIKRCDKCGYFRRLANIIEEKLY